MGQWYVERVSGTLKQGCDVRLGPRTVLWGRNKSGKSAIVQSLQLALAGFVTDSEGRDEVRATSSLARLFPSSVDARVDAWLVDAAEDEELGDPNRARERLHFEWQMERSGGKGKKPTTQQPCTVSFPVQTVLSKLRQSSNEFGVWLETLVMGNFGEEELVAALPPALQKEAVALAKRTKTWEPGALAKKAEAEATALSSQAQSKEETATKISEGQPPPLLEEARGQLDAQIEALRDELKDNPTGPAVPAGLTQAAYDDLATRVVGAREAVEQALAVRNNLPQPSADLARKQAWVETALQVVTTHAEHLGVDQCVVCGNGAAREGIALQQHRLTTARTLLAEQDQVGHTFRAVTAEVERRQGVLATLEAELAAAVVRPLPAEQPGLPLALGKLEGLVRKQAADTAARTVWATIEAAQAEIDQLKARADASKKLAAGLKRASKKLLADAKSKFETGVSLFVPPPAQVGVDLQAGRLGFYGEGDDIQTTLTGAQELQLLLAVAEYVSRLSSTPSVLVTADRGWDEDTLGETMAALKDSSHQVIVMYASKTPPPEVPGWTLVEVVAPE